MRCLKIIRRINLGLVAVGALSVLLPAPGWCRTVHDMDGQSVVVADHPQRIVTLAPSLAELAADIAGDNLQRIVGVSEFTDYPPALSKFPSIGPYARFNLERVLALRPDLALATRDGNTKEQVQHLRELKIPVVVVSSLTLDEVYRSIVVVAEAMGDRKTGDRLAARLRTDILAMRARTAKRSRHPRVLVQIGDEPLVVAGRQSFLNEVMEVLGAVNVFSEQTGRYPRPSYEEAIAKDPEIILVMDLGHAPEQFKRIAAKWHRFPGIEAVKKKQVKVVHGDSILRPSLRLTEGLVILERALYETR